MNLIAELTSYFNAPGLYKAEQVQALWSGYGEVARYCIPANQKKGIEQSFIVKHVELPDISSHPRGWNTSISHKRKIDSYKNEERFYAHYAHLCDAHCYVPKYLGSLKIHEPYPILLEDLNTLGFCRRMDSANLEQVRLGIRWLAYFHARFIDLAVDDLWPVGSYWHLATRLDEYEAMSEGKLKQAAEEIDSQVNCARYQTLVHGDAKIANFCWHQLESDLAAIDFQYVGSGIGVKDLMYFLGSCLSDVQLEKHGDDIVDTYFKLFHQALKHYKKEIDGYEVEQQWRALYPLTWADFHRFLLGWHPQHIKINHYMQSQTEIALANI